MPAGLLADQDDIRVREPPAVAPDALPRLREQLERVGAGERGIPGREERADVLEPGGAEKRVGERVRKDVAVRVAREAARMFDPDSAEHEGHALLERVRVEARADPVLRHAVPRGAD